MASLFKTMNIERDHRRRRRVAAAAAAHARRRSRRRAGDRRQQRPLRPVHPEGQGLPLADQRGAAADDRPAPGAGDHVPAEGLPPRQRGEHGREGPAARVRQRPGRAASRWSPRTASSASTSPTARPTPRCRKGDRLEAMLPERAFELLAIRREAIIEKGGPAARKATATKKAAAKRTGSGVGLAAGARAGATAAKKAAAPRKAAPRKSARASRRAGRSDRPRRSGQLRRPGRRRPDHRPPT